MCSVIARSLRASDLFSTSAVPTALSNISSFPTASVAISLKLTEPLARSSEVNELSMTSALPIALSAISESPTALPTISELPTESGARSAKVSDPSRTSELPTAPAAISKLPTESVARSSTVSEPSLTSPLVTAWRPSSEFPTEFWAMAVLPTQLVQTRSPPPLIVTLPATSSIDEGADVPMPTFPEESMAIRVALRDSASFHASILNVPPTLPIPKTLASAAASSSER